MNGIVHGMRQLMPTFSRGETFASQKNRQTTANESGMMADKSDGNCDKVCSVLHRMRKWIRSVLHTYSNAAAKRCRRRTMSRRDR